MRVWLKSGWKAEHLYKHLPVTTAISSVPPATVLLHFLFFPPCSFKLPLTPSKQSPDVRSEWVQQPRQQMTVNESRGPRNEKYEWQYFWNQSQTLTTPCSVRVTSCWAQCQRTFGEKYNNYFFTNRENWPEQLMPAEDWDTHFLLLPLVNCRLPANFEIAVRFSLDLSLNSYPAFYLFIY